jgi:hypothetical protein
MSGREDVRICVQAPPHLPKRSSDSLDSSIFGFANSHILGFV